MPRKVNVIGNRYGNLVVIGKEKKGVHWYRICQCDCGNVISVYLGSLQRGATLSCGCYHRQISKEVNTKHGMYGTRTYNIWFNLRQRCLNQKHHAYYRYGGRGISVCDEWHDFEQFYADMGDCPDGMSIDRIDNDGNYEPDNCRWSDYRQQSNNRSNNVYLEYEGKKRTIAEWSRELGIDYQRLYGYVSRGHSIGDILAFDK